MSDAWQRRLQFLKIAIPRAGHADSIFEGSGNAQGRRVAFERSRPNAFAIAIESLQSQIVREP